MADFDKEVIWATSTTGEDFQCVHVDFAREQKTEIERLRTAEHTMYEAAVYLAGALANPKLKDTALNKFEAVLAARL